MKNYLILLLTGLSLTVVGQTTSTSGSSKGQEVPTVESTWPGIQMQIPEIKRIPGNRLLAVVRLAATAHAPGSTLIGIPPERPEHPTKEESKAVYFPGPYSLTGSTLIDEQTHTTYAAVAPDPKGGNYRPGVVMTTLLPGQIFYMTVQFLAPPPPAPDETGKIPKQTASILLPRAKGPLKIVIPPPAPAAGQGQ